MSHVVQIMWRALKPDAENSEAAKKARELAEQQGSNIKGLVNFYVGPVMEMPSSVEKMAEWESVEALEAHKSSDMWAQMSKLQEELQDTTHPDLKPYEDHALMSGPLAPVADSPVVRIVAIVLPETVDQAGFEAAFREVHESNKATKPAGLRASIYGWTNRVDPNYRKLDGTSDLGPARFYMALVGWDSKEAGDAATASMDQEGAEKARKKFGAIDVRVAHVELKKVIG